MNPDDRRVIPDKPRPASQPHGTTEDQIHEMESEGPGVQAGLKPKSTPPPHQTTTVAIPGAE
jgi:hypothetical protein